MTTEKPRLLTKEDIVVGKPLPFSIFGTDKTLLLAQGQLVESERVRDALIRNGVLQDAEQAQNDSNKGVEADNLRLSPVALLRNDYHNLTSRARFGLRMSREDGGESYLCWVIGYVDRRGLIITAPHREDRSFVTVTEGQTWLFRTFYATAAFRFSAVVCKVIFEPLPYLHIQLPQLIDMRLVRKMPRAQACLNITVSGKQKFHGLIVDMSVSGLRLALPSECILAKDQEVNMEFTVPLLGRQHPMKMKGRVMSSYGSADLKHPNIAFYGISIEPSADFDQIVLHAYVQQQLVIELDSLWQTLAMEPRNATAGANAA